MNSQILDYLKNESATRTGFGARAYAKFIKVIESYSNDINTVDDLSNIDGISKGKIYDNCCKLLLGEIKFEKTDQMSFKDELARITGIGPAKVKELIGMGISNMDQLEKRKNELLNDKQLLGLKYHKYDQMRIPRKEIEEHHSFIQSIVKVLPDNTEFEIVGSYRRGNMDSGDIDILITNRNNIKGVFKQFVELLKENKYLVDDLAYGNVKYMGYSSYCGTPRRIDILYCTPQEYPFSILYFTGSGEFNKGMRKWCLENGYTLNEHGIYHIKEKKKGDRVKSNFTSEEDIFNYLGFKYITPNMRKTFNNIEKN